MTSKKASFPDVESNEQTSVVTEHRVIAEIELEDGGAFAEMKSDWDRRRDFVVETAEELRDAGHMVHVESRRRVETVEFEEVPE